MTTPLPEQIQSTSTLPPSQQPAVVQGFTQDQVNEMLERVRQEEKDKLYPRLTKADEQIQALTQWQQEQQANAAADAARVAEEQRKAEEAELSAVDLVERRNAEWQQQLEQSNHRWEEQLAAERAERERAQAILDQERRFNDLRQYAQAKVSANAESIAPQLLDWIQGNSEEEIDAAVNRAIATTEALVADLQQSGVAPGQVPVPAPAAPLGTRPTGGPSNIDPASHNQTLTPEQIRAMPMDQFAKIRGQLGVGNSSQGQGLYG